MAIREKALILRHEYVGGNFYEMEFYAPQMARMGKPGQFVHMACNETADPLLRRPFSLYRVNPDQGEVSILYAVVGRGTEIISHMKPGEWADILGPLGNGFTLVPEKSTALLIGGGVGIAPLLALADQLVMQNTDVKALLGMRTGETAAIIHAFQKAGATVHAATNDGSIGICGHVTDLLHVLDPGYTPTMVYACGPKPMLEKIQDWTAKHNWPAQLSLEEKMGCGLGACLSCVCKIKVTTDDGWTYKRVCVDGPVFDSREVLFND